MWGCTLSSSCPQSGRDICIFFLYFFFNLTSISKKHKHTHEWGHVCSHTLQTCNQRDGCVHTARRVHRRHACSGCGALARLPIPVRSGFPFPLRLGERKTPHVIAHGLAPRHPMCNDMGSSIYECVFLWGSLLPLEGTDEPADPSRRVAQTSAHLGG